jgi:chaperonin GroEL (HSP60 family)
VIVNVTRSALQNASDLASLMLTTEVMITELPEEMGSGMY